MFRVHFIPAREMVDLVSRNRMHFTDTSVSTTLSIRCWCWHMILICIIWPHWRQVRSATQFYSSISSFKSPNKEFTYWSSAKLVFHKALICRSQWPRGLRRGSATARLQGLWVRIPPRSWMFVTFECCVLSGKGLCVGLITRPEESYRLRCVCLIVIMNSR